MTETRTVHDPFTGTDAKISNRLLDRLRGKYAVGPTLPNGEPEFGWRQHPVAPINGEAADRIEALEGRLRIWLNDYERSADGALVTIPVHQLVALLGEPDLCDPTAAI